MEIPVIQLTRENLKLWRKQFYPTGSGPLFVMRMVVALIDAIAKEKSWDLIGDTDLRCTCHSNDSDTIAWYCDTCPKHGKRKSI